MGNKLSTIGVLTSGGDAPGMNAAIRAVVRSAIAKNMHVFGIHGGFSGLISKNVTEFNLRSVSDIIQLGGTKLRTSRCPEFKHDAGIAKAMNNCVELGIEGIVVIGGDGSFRGARDLSTHGIPCIGVPGTIDNDISSSEYTIGFDTATNTAMELVDKIRDTTESHNRCSVVEVMGRDAGYIALYAGIACGATCILVSEIDFDIDKDVIERLRKFRQTDKKHFIVVVSEGVGKVSEIAEKIEKEIGMESRATILGHVQRGGSPTARDRVLASEMGYTAVELLSQGIGNRVVVVQQNKIVDVDIHEALQMKKHIDERLYKIAHEISI